MVGSFSIPEDVVLTVDSDLNGASPQFTLTCVSTGGPATTVTRTRDSTTVTQGTQTVLNDPVTARYTHTLTVAGRLGGLYNCTVSNNKPSVVCQTFTVRGWLSPHALTTASIAMFSESSTDNTSAIIGGVVAVAVVLIITTSLTFIVVVILVLRSRSGNEKH